MPATILNEPYMTHACNIGGCFRLIDNPLFLSKVFVGENSRKFICIPLLKTIPNILERVEAQILVTTK